MLQSQHPSPATPALSDRERIADKLSRLHRESVQFVLLSTAGALLTAAVGWLFFTSGRVLIWQAGLMVMLASVGVIVASASRNARLVPWLLRRDSMALSPDEVRTWTILREDMPMALDEAARRARCTRAAALRAAQLLELIDEVAIRGERLERDR